MTNRYAERLALCFSAVFPDRSREEILSASRASIKEWDSLASVTLLALIQHEFHADIDLFDLEDLDSFQKLVDYLERQAATKGGDANRG
jgi:acyl carrier protein